MSGTIFCLRISCIIILCLIGVYLVTSLAIGLIHLRNLVWGFLMNFIMWIRGSDVFAQDCWLCDFQNGSYYASAFSGVDLTLCCSDIAGGLGFARLFPSQFDHNYNYISHQFNGFR